MVVSSFWIFFYFISGADFCTDSEIQSLTREDLHELFPGAEKLKLRRTIFGIIHKRVGSFCSQIPRTIR